MIENEKARKRKSKDRDGIYRRRGHWHFEYKDPQTGQWRSKTTGRTSYNDAKESSITTLSSKDDRSSQRRTRSMRNNLSR
jgi:hypothetical protein